MENRRIFMKKILTIFERDWEGNRGVIDKPITGLDLEILKQAVATEKLDGTNVRVTIRGGTCVRLEKRRNPDKIQKQKGIVEPWYVDADEYDSGDKWLYDALKHTDLQSLPDGEWSGEAIGLNIQGNPLNLPNNRIVFFTLGQAPVFDNVPITYQSLKEWLPKQKSKYGNNCKIEGIVWHFSDGRMYKIKAKDFEE
jgi:hypothetical protein